MTPPSSQQIVDDLVASVMDVLVICRDRFEMRLPFVVELSWSDGTIIKFRAHSHEGGLEILSVPQTGALLSFPCEVDIRDIEGVHKSFTMIADPIPVPVTAPTATVH